MAATYLPLEEVSRGSRCSGKVLALVSLLSGFGCGILWIQANTQYSAASDSAIDMAAWQSMQIAKSQHPATRAWTAQPTTARRTAPAAMAWKTISMQMQDAEAKTASTAAAAIRGLSRSGASSTTSPLLYASAAKMAARDGARAGCRGNLVCVRAVGLFFGTQTGKTEEVAGLIAGETGLEAQSIDDVEAGDLAGYDGLIVGAPTWHTGADEQRTGTAWDDYFEQIRGLDLCGKPVAVFGVGDSAGYGDNFCDAIEEMHSTFEAAGAKMLGYVNNEGYSHSETKSVRDGKFLGLPLDQDNEDDLSEKRVKDWVSQIKGEGMPVM